MMRHHAGRSWATAGSVVRTATTAPTGSGSTDSRSSISKPVPMPRAPPSMRTAGSGTEGNVISASKRPVAGQTLVLDGFEQHAVAFQDGGIGRDPAFQPFQVH